MSRRSALADPYTGVCTDGVEVMDCLPPMQWSWDTLCVDLDPPCGNPGACCDDYSGECVDNVFEVNCAGTRFEPGGTCDDFEPACGDLDFTFVFDPGTGPPPATLCGCPMTPHPADPRPTLTDVADVPSPCPIGGDIEFSIPLSHRRIGEGWSSWSHGYTGDVYYSNGATEVTLTLPLITWGFYFYVEPNQYGVHTFQLTVNGVIVSEEFTADGDGGAACAGVCTRSSPPETITIECTSGADFAIGEFGICCFAPSPWGSCCDPFTGECANDVDVMDCFPPLHWMYETDCADLDPPCGNPGACCDPYTGGCEDNVLELNCPEDFRFEAGQPCAELEPECGTPGACCDDDTAGCTQEFEANCDGRFIGGAACDPDPFDPPCGEYHACPHEIVMWDDYGDGWNGGFIDVYVDGELVLAAVTLASGFGPESVFFEAATGATIQTIWTPGGSPCEASYCIYDGLGEELGCDGLGGVEPTGITVFGNCGPPVSAGLDITPGACPNPINRTSYDFLPVAVVGMGDFDVMEIDISTIRLSRADGVGGELAPYGGPPWPQTTFRDVATPFDGEPCDCHEAKDDGILDLSLKFSVQALVDALDLAALDAGDEVELVVTGALLDGAAFMTTGDCIVIARPQSIRLWRAVP